MLAVAIALSCIAYLALYSPKTSEQATTVPLAGTDGEDKTSADNAVTYHNEMYGFDFDLPQSWKGYKVVDSTWEGYAIASSASHSQERVAQGPQLLLRNPQWTEEKPYQDIPIMVFTLEEWNDMQADKFHIGAAPINPSELGRNNKYVFALPARYNYAFPEGYEEVENILEGKPLHAKDI